jgi:glycolate oxidase FAD binding subunit
MTEREQQEDSEFQPSTQQELARFVTENNRNARRELLPVGGRTSLDPGRLADCRVTRIDLTQLNRVVDFPHRDMTITVEAGMRIDDLQSILAEQKQQLPLDIPQSRRATLGGAVASNANGPRRFGYGTLRDHVIGITAVDARGRLFHSGGRVVKNVAGYDLCKLMIGSRGSLAIISQVTLKLRPLPDQSRLLWITLPNFDDIDIALECLTVSRTRPVALEVLNRVAAQQISQETGTSLDTRAPVLGIGIEGSAEETAWQLDTLREEVRPFGPLSMQVVDPQKTPAVWTALTEFPTRCDSPLTFQANLRPSQTMPLLELADQHDIALIARAGNGTVIGQLPEEGAAIAPFTLVLKSIHDHLTQMQGQLEFLNCDPKWNELADGLQACGSSGQLMQQLKHSFDPASLLNPRSQAHTTAPSPIESIPETE